MRRFHNEISVMLTRWKEEKRKHALWGDSFEDCHCSKGPGLMRKNRPYSNSNHDIRWILAIEQYTARESIKKNRQREQIIIKEQMEYDY